MAENKAVSLAPSNSECFQTSKMPDARLNGVIHENDNGVSKLWSENGKYFDTRQKIAPNKMNGFYNHKASSSGTDTKPATTLRSSPTRNKITTPATSPNKKDVNSDDKSLKKSHSKSKGTVHCKWMDCDFVTTEITYLADHAREEHINPMRCCDIFVCLWKDCKVFNKPSCSMTWLTKHLESHIGIKPFRCVIDACPLSFSSQLALARHVPCHFEDDVKPMRKSNNGKDESPGKRNLKRKRLKYIRYKKIGAKTEDFVDQHAVDSIKKRLTYMVVSDNTNHVGINGSMIHFRSQALGKRILKNGDSEVLLHWVPESIIEDEWVALEDVKQHERRCLPICSLPNQVKADLHPSFYRRLSRRKGRRK